MIPQTRKLLLRTERATQLLQEAEELAHEDMGATKNLINEALNVLYGFEDRDLFIITKSRETNLGKWREETNEKQDKIETATHIQCVHCKQSFRIYKIKEKWVIKCDCGQILTYQGSLTQHAKKITRTQHNAMKEGKARG